MKKMLFALLAVLLSALALASCGESRFCPEKWLTPAGFCHNLVEWGVSPEEAEAALGVNLRQPPAVSLDDAFLAEEPISWKDMEADLLCFFDGEKGLHTIQYTFRDMDDERAKDLYCRLESLLTKAYGKEGGSSSGNSLQIQAVPEEEMQWLQEKEGVETLVHLKLFRQGENASAVLLVLARPLPPKMEPR